MVVTTAETLQFPMPMCLHLVGLASGEHINHIIGLELVFERSQHSERSAQVFRGVYLVVGMQAVVAVSAVVAVVFLAKVMQQELAPAHRSLGICCYLLYQLPAYVLFGHRFPLHELFQFAHILGRIEGEADALSPIPAGAPRLLVVSLKALWDVVVYDKPHVWLVNAHSKRYGGHDDFQPFHDEVVLGLVAHLRFHAGMVGTGVDVVGAQHLGQFLHFLPAQAIDNATLPLVLQNEAYNVLFHIGSFGTHLVIEVGAVERTAEFHCIIYAQAFLDVFTHLVGGRSCKRNNGSDSYLVDYRPDPTIFGTEIMPPLRYAMSLVDGIEGNFYA